MKDAEALHGDAVRPHATGHAHTEGNATACAARTTTDRTRLALRVLLTVGAATAMEAVALHDALESLTI